MTSENKYHEFYVLQEIENIFQNFELKASLGSPKVPTENLQTLHVLQNMLNQAVSHDQQKEVNSILTEINETFRGFEEMYESEMSSPQIDSSYAISRELLDISLSTPEHLNYSTYQNSYLLTENMEDYQKLKPLIDSLKQQIGAKQCVLCVMYPEKGYVSWHHNSDIPGPNVRFQWSETGDGVLATYDEKRDSLCTIPDSKGWSVACGHFAPNKGILHDMMGYGWHAMATNCKRFTLGFQY